ncbi:hypothetical protein B0H12DRAFT_53674 [Mycena haematopus]|nr:hypothetical protein B0H12DRAFT_53674 [Mycena haematopus]
MTPKRVNLVLLPPLAYGSQTMRNPYLAGQKKKCDLAAIEDTKDRRQRNLESPNQIPIEVTYFNEGLGVNPAGPSQASWKCEVKGSKPLRKLFRKIQENLSEDTDSLKFFYLGITLHAEDTPERVSANIFIFGFTIYWLAWYDGH